jgi:hypothetical protein
MSLACSAPRRPWCSNHFFSNVVLVFDRAILEGVPKHRVWRSWAQNKGSDLSIFIDMILSAGTRVDFCSGRYGESRPSARFVAHYDSVAR